MNWRRLGTGLAMLAGVVTGLDAAHATFRGFTADGEETIRPPDADGRNSAAPKIAAVELIDQSVKVDGKLDDPVWLTAPTASGFKVWDPDRGAPPPEETLFKVAYDRDAIYFAIACLEKDAGNIEAKLARRDVFSNSDLVSIYIDPYHDRTTGYNFKVNPLGVQVDSYIFADGERDDNWNAVWQGETSRDQDGWYAEVRVPFSAIRYKKEAEMTWGLNVWRRMHNRGIEASWTNWPRDQSGFVSRFGELTGLKDISATRAIEVLPYVLQRSTDPSVAPDGPGFGEDDFDNNTNFGGDLKYGVTSDMTLNATIQPDFGQVEADAAELNLSPFETFYDEKRPFFVEGNKHFTHPNFNLFYSRRIGTGDQNARIRFASKLTGKVSGNTTLAVLAAATDLTERGQAHNLFKNGARQSYYGVARLGRQFANGRHRFNLMGTAVNTLGSPERFGDYWSREAYTGGADWEMNFKNRTYRLQGSAVGSIVDSEENETLGGLPDKVYGTGGSLQFNKRGGKFYGGMSARWEHDKLRLNDVGFLSAPDEISTSAWLSKPMNQGGKSRMFNNGEVNFNFWRSWLYGARHGNDLTTGETVWAYGKGHPQFMGTNVNTWMQFRNYMEYWMGIEVMPEGTQRYETRGGPLISEPTTYGTWYGGSTDTRKDLTFNFDGNYYADTEKNFSTNFVLGSHWNQSSSMVHDLKLAFRYREDDTQYLETVSLTERPGGVGIGGQSYVFGDITQRTLDLTLRSSFLFSRTASLELYVQPFVTVGEYSRVRELATADTYDLVPYEEAGYDSHDFDFEYGSVNLNAVWRWEYRPGSTFFLVWTHGRESYDQRNFHAPGESFKNNLGTSALFNNEPTNTILAKFTYYLSL
jgi:hypothetical protein